MCIFTSAFVNVCLYVYIYVCIRIFFIHIFYWVFNRLFIEFVNYRALFICVEGSNFWQHYVVGSIFVFIPSLGSLLPFVNC